MELTYRADGRLTLSSARTLFRELRKDSGAIIIKRHAWADHPERHFTRDELLSLLRFGSEDLIENVMAATATFGSFLFSPKDDEGRECELALILDEVGSWKIVVIHAFRRV